MNTKMSNVVLGEALVLRDDTDMGGTSKEFLTTHGSLIEGIKKQKDLNQS